MDRMVGKILGRMVFPSRLRRNQKLEEMTHALAVLERNTKSVMAIKPKCDKCRKELNEFGGILLSPPKKNIVKKFHLCIECYKEISSEIDVK